jgi:Putative porin
MKSVLRWCVVPLLAGTLLAQTAAKPKAKRAAAKPAQPAVTLQDIQSLKDALAAQQQQIEQLKQAVQQKDAAWQQAQQQLQQAQAAASDAQSKAAAAESAANSQKDTVVKLDSDMADVKTTLTNTAVGTQEEQKRMSALEGLVGRFRLNGDVRVRGESFFQNGTQDRNRARIRVRFGFDGKLNDDFIAGVALASGSLGDPTSTNETMTNFFDRKTIAIDRGYITYNPVAHKWISVTGGKFAYSWIRTPMMFDNDLNPEGFSEKLSFDLHSPVIKNVSLMGMQLLFNEASGGKDSYAIGGQASTRLQLGRFWTTTASLSALKWNNVDALLNATAFAVAQSPGEGPGCKGGVQGLPASTGGANCVFASNNFTNAVTTRGTPHFFSQFLPIDFILNNQFKTPWARLPLNVLGEFIINPEAASHPLGSSGNFRADLASQNKAYMVDVSIGQQRNKNDVQVGYAWNRIEQDAVLASFVESDQRTQTNVLQNRLYGLWRVRSNVTAAYTYWFGRTLNTSLQNATRSPGVAPGQEDARLDRMQFDLIYTF